MLNTVLENSFVLSNNTYTFVLKSFISCFLIYLSKNENIMGKYGKSALIAANILISKRANSPDEAWESAVSQVFPDSESARKKGCPKNAFLGLCEAGLINYVPQGNYTRSKANKGYALKAISILQNNPALANDKKTLWQLVIDGQEKQENHQMDIVTSLWSNALIKREKY